jgi:hypothetical protein
MTYPLFTSCLLWLFLFAVAVVVYCGCCLLRLLLFYYYYVYETMLSPDSNNLSTTSTDSVNPCGHLTLCDSLLYCWEIIQLSDDYYPSCIRTCWQPVHTLLVSTPG